MNFEIARHNMIEQQIRTWEVLDTRVLEMLSEIHREDFVPPEYKELALADTSIPLEHGQITMTPKVEARIMQAVSVQPGDKVLEVGTGCAYMTALLCHSAKEVISVDLFPDFIEEARIKLEKYNLNNFSLETGDAVHGWPSQAPYDVIVVTGSVPELDVTFQQQLTTGGRLFVIVGESPVMQALLITRAGENAWHTETLFDTDLPPLIGTRKSEDFHL